MPLRPSSRKYKRAPGHRIDSDRKLVLRANLFGSWFSALVSFDAEIQVHGGGCVVDEMLAQAGFTTEKKDGLRVTPAEQIPLIGGALAGTVNKTIVANANSLGLNAVGLSLTDGNMVNTVKGTNKKGFNRVYWALDYPNKSGEKLIEEKETNGFGLCLFSQIYGYQKYAAECRFQGSSQFSPRYQIPKPASSPASSACRTSRLPPRCA